MTGMKKTFFQRQGTRKSLKQMKNQLLLVFYLYHTMRKKSNKHIFQNTAYRIQAK